MENYGGNWPIAGRRRVVNTPEVCRSQSSPRPIGGRRCDAAHFLRAARAFLRACLFRSFSGSGVFRAIRRACSGVSATGSKSGRFSLFFTEFSNSDGIILFALAVARSNQTAVPLG